jgi:hypothetical protein
MSTAFSTIAITVATHIRDFAVGCRGLSGAVCAPFEPMAACGSELSSLPQSDGAQIVGLWELAAAALGDVRMLHQRMEFMHIDRDEFACAQPAVMRQLTVCCVQCGSTGECAQDLSDTLTGLLGGEWRDYCPNAAMLSKISALQAAGVSFGPEKPRANQRVTSCCLRHRTG